MQIPGWETDESTKLTARDLAIELIESRLDEGNDVLVPQFLGKVEFIERLEATAQKEGAEFIEVLLEADPSASAARFRARRSALAVDGEPHPQDEVAEDHIESLAADAHQRLNEVQRTRRSVRIVSASGSMDQTYRGLLAALATDRA